MSGTRSRKKSKDVIVEYENPALDIVLNTSAATALLYAYRGWAVLPLYGVRNGVCRCRKQKDCSEPGKHLQKGITLADATTDPMKIACWWRKWPKANIGIATGHVSDLVVININAPNREGKSGKARRVLAALRSTPKTITGGGGRHLLFEYPNTASTKNIATKLKKTGCEVLSDGDYFVAPGSSHTSGGRYCWVKGKSIRDLKPSPLIAVCDMNA